MLGNNEKIQGVDLKAVFTKMLTEVPWDNLKAYIQANAQLIKLCTAGGFRLEPKMRKRAESFILRDVEKGEFSELLCNGVFASWYPVHKDLHKTLEDYFHSDEYKAYREEHKLSEDEYVLSDEKFSAFFDAKEFEAWRILLCFSPLKFTEEQAAKIIEDKKEDADLMSRIANAESERDSLSKKVAQLTAEAEKLRARQQSDQNEILELRKQNRQFKTDNENLMKKVEIAVAEMKRSNQQLAQAGEVAEQRENAARAEAERGTQRLQNEIDRLNKELVSWQNRYEAQCEGNRELEEKASAAEKRCQDAIALKETFELKISDNQKLVDSILTRIDWVHVGASMKLSPTMKRSFNTLLKRLDYDEDRNLTIGTTLQQFWGHLIQNERVLIDAIAKSTEKELINGSIKEYWQGLASQFTNAQTSLEARLCLLSIMQDIFYQTYTDEDLQAATAAPKAPKKSAKKE